MNALFLEEVDIDEMKPVPTKSLSNITISPQMLAILMQFNLIKEE